VVIQHRGKHTRYTHPRGLPLSLPLSLPSPSSVSLLPVPSAAHVLGVCLYIHETRSTCHCLACGGRLTFRNTSSTPPISFQPIRVKEGRGHIDSKGRKEEKTLFTMRGYIRDISRPLSVSRCRSNSSGSAHVRVYPLEEKGRSQPSLPPLPFSLSDSLALSRSPMVVAPFILLPILSLGLARSSALSKFADGQRPRGPRSVWPRIRDSYLLTESSRKGVIERRVTVRRCQPRSYCEGCETFMHPATYESIQDEILSPLQLLSLSCLSVRSYVRPSVYLCSAFVRYVYVKCILGRFDVQTPGNPQSSRHWDSFPFFPFFLLFLSFFFLLEEEPTLFTSSAMAAKRSFGI